MPKSKYKWLNLRKKTEPEYPVEPPIWMGNHSNGEYFHEQTPREAKMRQEILRRADEQSSYLGMDRREFLASSMGMATSLAVINACSSDTPDQDVGAASTKPYVVPPETTCEESAYIDQEYFIMDVQTHAFDAGDWRTKNTAYPIFLNLLSSCADKAQLASPLDCFDRRHYGELMFADSETTLSVITSWPAAECFAERNLLGNAAMACGLPLSNEGMRDLRDWINQNSMSQRCINQVQVMPNDMLELQIEGMYAAMEDETWRCGSWKAYPAWRSDTYTTPEGYAQGYYMSDKIGRAFIEAGLKLGVPNFAIHKGLPIPGFDVIHNEPTDIGPIAADYPDANFVIYHSGINARTGGDVASAVAPQPTEKVPYDNKAPEKELTGVNVLIRSLVDHGLITVEDDGSVSGRVKRLNVFAEMGSAWRQVMLDKVQSQHYIGKLLKYFGEDNIVWGTDCILTGSPKSQIAAFKAFDISDEFVEQFGYQKLTKEIKAKIFGLNAARIYHVNPDTARCQVQNSNFEAKRQQLDDELGPNRFAAKLPMGPRNRREFLNLAKWNKSKRLPG